MKKRKFEKKLVIKKISISNLISVKGGGTHYEWCKDGYTDFPCTIGNER